MHQGRMPLADWALALGLALLAVVTRWPYRPRLLPTWDAVQFALALRDFDVVRHQPHPPGYILYVAAGRLLATILPDPAAALAAVAMLASAVAVLCTYRLGWQWNGRTAATLTALGLLTSPLFWAYGTLGLSYTAEAALAAAIALAVWSMRDGRMSALLASAALLGLGAGVRQSLLIVLGPLWLGMAWLTFRRRRPLLLGLGVMAAAVAVWLAPMLWLTGGLARYLAAGIELYGSTVHATTVFGGGWHHNVTGLGAALLVGVGGFLPVLAAGAWRQLRAVREGDRRAALLALWVVPAVTVYTLVHLGQPGYLLTILPACYLVVGGTLASWLAVDRRGGLARRAAGRMAIGAVLAGHALFFLAAGPVDVPFPDGSAPWHERLAADARAFYRFRLWPETAAGLRERQDVIRAYVETVRRDFDARDTVLVTELGNPRSYPWFRHVMYYLPEFAVYHLRLGEAAPAYLTSRDLGTMAAIGARRVPLPASTRRIVWVVDYWHPGVPPPDRLEARPLPLGRWLYVLRVGRRPVEYAGYRLTPVTAVAAVRTR
jgi:uncharacterized membrane protein YidH (DUF202 family)